MMTYARNYRLKMLTKSQKEGLAAAFCPAVVLILTPMAIAIVLYFIIFGHIGRYISILYLLWIYIDRDRASKGDRRSAWFRNLSWWGYQRDYFPIKLHKTAALPADKNYLVAIVPHGVMVTAGFSVFTTDAHNLAEVFPGITFYLTTIMFNFLLPFFRELAQLLGNATVSRKSLDLLLGHPQGGKAAVIYIGGGGEALYSGLKDITLKIKNRRGFCRLSLVHGSPIVPTFAFGEKDLYTIYTPTENTIPHKIQQFVKRVCGMVPLIFYGSKDSYYLLPHRIPLHVVVGKPIEVNKTPNPSKEEVEALYQRFIKDITELYEKYKVKFQSDQECKLVFA